MQQFKVGDLRRLVMESTSEFKAKLGPNVEKDDKRINDTSYKESEKRAKEFNGGINPPVKPKYEKKDYNRTTLDFGTEEDVDKEYKKRVHAQAEGYSSVMEKNNGEEKSGEFSSAFYDGAKKSGKELNDETAELKHTGLTASKLPKEKFETKDIYESAKPVTLYFKKTQFLSEEHMRSRIPDEFKVDGKRFMMKDKTDNQYLVEWKDNKAVIIEHSNKAGLNEALDRMKSLMSYNTSSSLKNYTSVNEREDGFMTTLNNARKATC